MWIENPRVGGSIPPLGTIIEKPRNSEAFSFIANKPQSTQNHR